MGIRGHEDSVGAFWCLFIQFNVTILGVVSPLGFYIFTALVLSIGGYHITSYHCLYYGKDIFLFSLF